MPGQREIAAQASFDAVEKGAERMTQTWKSPEDARNSLARKSKTDQTASNATTPDPYTE